MQPTDHALNARLLRFRSQPHLRPDGREREDAASLARDLMRAGRFGDARGVLVAAQDPEAPDPGLLLLEGRAWYEQGSRDAALSTFLQVSQASPDAPDAFYWMGKCLLDADDPLRAATALRHCLARCPAEHPEYNRAQQLLHRALTRMDRVDEQARLEAARAALGSIKGTLSKVPSPPHEPTSPGLGIHALGAVLTPSVATGASSAGDIDAPEMASSAGFLDAPHPASQSAPPSATTDMAVSTERPATEAAHTNQTNQTTPAAQISAAQAAAQEPPLEGADGHDLTSVFQLPTVAQEGEDAAPTVAEQQTPDERGADDFRLDDPSLDDLGPDAPAPDGPRLLGERPADPSHDAAADHADAAADHADAAADHADAAADHADAAADHAEADDTDAEADDTDADDPPRGAFSSAPALGVEEGAGDRIRGAFSARTLLGAEVSILADGADDSEDDVTTDGTPAEQGTVSALPETALGFLSPGHPQAEAPAPAEEQPHTDLGHPPQGDPSAPALSLEVDTRGVESPGTPRRSGRAWALTTATALACATVGYLVTAHVGLPWLRGGEPPVFAGAGPVMSRLFATAQAPAERREDEATGPVAIAGTAAHQAGPATATVAAAGSPATEADARNTPAQDAPPQPAVQVEAGEAAEQAPADDTGAPAAEARPAPSGSADDLQQASQQLELGQLAEAEQHYRRVPKSLAQSPEGRVIGARLWLATGRARRALRTVAPLRAQQDRTAEQLAVIGDVLHAVDRVNTAAGAYEQALALDPDHARALVGRAEIHSRARRPVDAIALLRRAAALITDQTPALRSRMQTALGRAYLQRGGDTDHRLAENALRRALTFSAPPAAAYFWLGESQAARATPAATRAYVRYLELEPTGRYAARARQALGPLLSE